MENYRAIEDTDCFWCGLDIPKGAHVFVVDGQEFHRDCAELYGEEPEEILRTPDEEAFYQSPSVKFGGLRYLDD